MTRCYLYWNPKLNQNLGDSYDASGRLIVRNQSATFVVRAGNFGGKSKAADVVVPAIPAPNRKPDASVQYKTSVDQAALYRLVRGTD